MRDNHDLMPEIISTLEEGGEFFGVVGIEKTGRYKKFRFGVSNAAHKALKNILQLRPFDTMPGLRRRFFYSGGISKVNQLETYRISVRVEQGRTGKNIDAEVTKDLAANLQWFYELKDLEEAAHLPEEI
jgi:hypothetical protein